MNGQQLSPFQNMAALVQMLNAGSRPGGAGYQGNPIQQLAQLQQAKAMQTGSPIMQMPGMSQAMNMDGITSLLKQMQSIKGSAGAAGGAGGLDPAMASQLQSK